MFQYLSAYKANRNLSNAKRLIQYLDKHPMAVCVTTDEDMAVIADARRLWDR